ncbi:MAG: hypothetical protein GX860_10740, partial [Alcaligenaceae bacterium]|nr:hypothetical protein [Alcaligenaceae bacterium]
QGSLPVGNISSNEIDIRLVNEDGKFDAGNRQSPLYQLLKPNRRIKAWLGTYIDYDIVPTEFLVDTDTEWNQGVLTDVVAVDGGLELWQPEYYANFDNNINLTKNDGTTISPESGAIYTLRPNEGKFGGCVAVEEGTENGVQNGDFSTGDFTGWPIWGSGGTRTIVQTEYGNAAKITHPDSDYSYSYGIESTKGISVQAGEKVTVSFLVKGDRPNYAYLMLSPTPNHAINNQIRYKTLNNGWERGVYTWTAEKNCSVGFLFAYSDTDFNEGIFTQVQIEKKPFATSFVDGSREDGVLIYPNSVLSLKEATVAAWVKIPPSTHWYATHYRRIISNANSSSSSYNSLIFYILPEDKKLYLDLKGDDGERQVISSPEAISEGWHYLAATWSSDEMAIYVDGVKVAQRANPVLPSLHPNPWVAIGARTDGMDHINSLIDELLILPYAATKEEIARWYEQSLPLQRSERGNRTQQYNLSHIATVNDSVISWQETLNGQTATIETNLSIDGGNTWLGWKECTNGGNIPDITAGMDLSNAILDIRQTLSTNDTTVTPRLEQLKITINGIEYFPEPELKYIPLGTFWSGDWTAPEGEIYVQTTGRDRLELLSQSTYSNSQVRQNVTLYELAIDVLEDYGLESED